MARRQEQMQCAGRRFAMLWAPASEALAMALRKNPEAAWPLVFAQLAGAQAAFLSGRGRGLSPGAYLQNSISSNVVTRQYVVFCQYVKPSRLQSPVLGAAHAWETRMLAGQSLLASTCQGILSVCHSVAQGTFQVLFNGQMRKPRAASRRPCWIGTPARWQQVALGSLASLMQACVWSSCSRRAPLPLPYVCIPCVIAHSAGPAWRQTQHTEEKQLYTKAFQSFETA